MTMRIILIVSRVKKGRDLRLQGLGKIFKIQTVMISSKDLNLSIGKQIIILKDYSMPSVTRYELCWTSWF